jgi:group II intron reverse transcriptase/maturase
MVWEAYKLVRANRGSAGVDGLSMEEFDAERKKHLYKLWNLMTSGSYFPPAVKEVEIPKKDGKVRKLGIPTISDRVGQMVVKQFMEPRLEQLFSENSYGYRPNKNAHQALESVRKNCWKINWVIDLDIKGFFDNIDHKKLMRAVEKHFPEKWVQLYVRRWLETPVQRKDGALVGKHGKGTPQGGVISPLLANLYLHYALDEWLERHDKTMKFARYADDAILHCHSKTHAERTLKALERRLAECDLELHPGKTKIVYCKDYRRQGKHREVKFDFLGYSFQPRTTKSKRTGNLFLGFDCAISISSRKRIADQLGAMNLEKDSCESIVGIAYKLNPMIQGWVHYYGKFRGYELSKVFQLLRKRLVRWARNRYKRYRRSLNKAYHWLERVRKQYPKLFYQWQVGYSW